MLNAKSVYKQITQLTGDVIASGLCDAQNHPSMTQKPGEITEIGTTGTDHSIYLKNIPYADLYAELNNRRQYNLKMIDGALISLSYRFHRDHLTAHRLSFLPAPDLEVFQNAPEAYMEDELYIEFTDKRLVTVPIRFDFDDGEAFIPVEHPKSHLTLGQYEHCRIPVRSAVSPYYFLTFILNHFYHINSRPNLCRLTKYADTFPPSIVPDEQLHIYIHTP